MPVNASNDKLGWKAPDFNLLNVNEKILSLEDIRGSRDALHQIAYSLSSEFNEEPEEEKSSFLQNRYPTLH